MVLEVRVNLSFGLKVWIIEFSPKTSPLVDAEFYVEVMTLILLNLVL